MNLLTRILFKIFRVSLAFIESSSLKVVPEQTLPDTLRITHISRHKAIRLMVLNAPLSAHRIALTKQYQRDSALKFFLITKRTFEKRTFYLFVMLSRHSGEDAFKSRVGLRVKIHFVSNVVLRKKQKNFS